MERGLWGRSWVVGALAVVLVGACAKAPRQEAGIAWKTTFDTTVADAGKNGRPILLDFYTDW